MKLVIGTVATLSGVLFLLSIASANPALHAEVLRSLAGE